jgi:hypothetical protein
MINTKNGFLDISIGLNLYSQQPVVEFENRFDINSWENVIRDQMYIGYRKDVVDYEQRKLNVAVYFIKKCLWSVDLSFFLSGETEYRFREGNYPNADMKRWYLHEAILRTQLGDPPYNYPWGFIALGHSQLDRLAIIKVNYPFSGNHSS